jgi:NADPH-dependent curcumin reductase CurA
MAAEHAGQSGLDRVPGAALTDGDVPCATWISAHNSTSRWLADGRLHSVEDTVRADIDAFPDMLARLFTGTNTGNLVLELKR